MSRGRGVWWAGLVVAGAAAAATAHGLYAVATASGVPPEIAVLYPVMTDGLALVAYSATNRLDGAARRYAWTVVLAAAGLSGLAQAIYLAGDGVHHAPAEVRFGIGAVPAIAAAAVAHLLHLIRTASLVDEPTVPVQDSPAVQAPPAVQSPEAERPDPSGVRTAAVSALVVQPVQQTHPEPARPPAGGAAGRAEQAARRHHATHGALPTATELVRLTGVSRGTAGTVLKALRDAADATSSPPDTPTTTPAPPTPAPASEQTEQQAAPLPDDSEPPHHDHPTQVPNKIEIQYTPRHHDPQEDQLRADSGPIPEPATGR